MTNHPTAKKAKRAKSKRPAKVRAVKAVSLQMWEAILHSTGNVTIYKNGPVGSPITIVPGHVGIDFTITPKARPRNGK